MRSPIRIEERSTSCWRGVTPERRRPSVILWRSEATKGEEPMANPSMDRDVVAWPRQQLQKAHPDLLREMLATMVQELMGAEAQQACGAVYGEPTTERSNSRNCERELDCDTRAGTIA